MAALAQVSPKELLNIQAFELQRVLDFDPEFLGEEQEHQHDSSVTSVSCRIKGNVNQTMLSRWISRLIQEDGANLYRYKGILSIKGVDEKFIFQGVVSIIIVFTACVLHSRLTYTMFHAA